jgi:hypothetical protein
MEKTLKEYENGKLWQFKESRVLMRLWRTQQKMVSRAHSSFL